MPFLDGPPQKPREWYEAFLVHLAENGSVPMALHHVRAGRGSYDWAIHEDRMFREQVEQAEAYYIARLEWEAVHCARTTGNPLPYHGRLKAEKPEKYLERNLSLSLAMHTDLDAVDVLPVLAKMMRDATPATQAALAAQNGAGETRDIVPDNAIRGTHTHEQVLPLVPIDGSEWVEQDSAP